MESYPPKIRTTISTILAIFSLSACINGQTNTPDENQEKTHLYKNNSEAYSINVPVGFSHTTDDEEGIYFGYATTSKFGNLLVQSYDNKIIHPILEKGCSPAVTGASETKPLPQTGDSTWGKVDFFEKYAGEGGTIDYVGERPLCAEPSSAISRYAFCAQKNGKTVVICIEQMKDNPQMAEDIFSTFKWLK